MTYEKICAHGMRAGCLMKENGAVSMLTMQHVSLVKFFVLVAVLISVFQVKAGLSAVYCDNSEFTVPYIPNIQQTRRVPTGRSYTVPDPDPWVAWAGGSRTIREWQDKQITLTAEDIAISLTKSCDRQQGNGWYYCHVCVNGKWEIMSFRIDDAQTKWFIDTLVDCARHGGGWATICQESLLWDSEFKCYEPSRNCQLPVRVKLSDSRR